MNDLIRHLIAISLAASLGFAGLIACDPPEEVEAPVDEEGTEEIEEPQAPTAPEDDQPGAQQAPDQDMAIDQPPQQGMPGQGMDLDEELSDEDVDKYADVVRSLQALDEDREDPQARMEAAETAQERQEIQSEMMNEMQEAIEGAGMSFHEFMMMSQRLQQDPDFQQRLEERVDLSDLMPDEGAQQAPPAHSH